MGPRVEGFRFASLLFRVLQLSAGLAPKALGCDNWPSKSFPVRVPRKHTPSMEPQPAGIAFVDSSLNHYPDIRVQPLRLDNLSSRLGS